MVDHQQIRTALLEGSSLDERLEGLDAEALFYVESELVEDYLEGSLSEKQSELFRTNYLVSEERRELLNEVRLLKRFSSGSFNFDAEKFEQTVIHEEGRNRLGPALIAAAAIAILILLAWFFYTSRSA